MLSLFLPIPGHFGPKGVSWKGKQEIRAAPSLAALLCTRGHLLVSSVNDPGMEEPDRTWHESQSRRIPSRGLFLVAFSPLLPCPNPGSNLLVTTSSAVCLPSFSSLNGGAGCEVRTLPPGAHAPSVVLGPAARHRLGIPKKCGVSGPHWFGICTLTRLPGDPHAIKVETCCPAENRGAHGTLLGLSLSLTGQWVQSERPRMHLTLHLHINAAAQPSGNDHCPVRRLKVRKPKSEARR